MTDVLDTLEKRVADAAGRLAELRDENAALRARVAELDGELAARRPDSESAWEKEREQIRQRIVQVLEALTADVDRDMERRIALLETLSTSPLLMAEDWPGFYKQAKDSLRGRAYIVLIGRDGRQIINTFVPYGE